MPKRHYGVLIYDVTGPLGQQINDFAQQGLHVVTWFMVENRVVGVTMERQTEKRTG